MEREGPVGRDDETNAFLPAVLPVTPVEATPAAIAAGAATADVGTVVCAAGSGESDAETAPVPLATATLEPATADVGTVVCAA